MTYLEYCSNCGLKIKIVTLMAIIDIIVQHVRLFIMKTQTNCNFNLPNRQVLLLGRRAFSPGKGQWGLPGGFMELNETLEEAATRELKEETNLSGKFKNIRNLLSLREHIR